MPVVYMIIPTLVMACGLHNAGSVAAGTVMLVSLVIGWSWRMLERFAMDGCGPMNAVHALQARWLTQQRPVSGVQERVLSAVLTTLAALVSPTAVLHFFTGVTLLFGFLMVRSLDADTHLP